MKTRALSVALHFKQAVCKARAFQKRCKRQPQHNTNAQFPQRYKPCLQKEACYVECARYKKYLDFQPDDHTVKQSGHKCCKDWQPLYADVAHSVHANRTEQGGKRTAKNIYGQGTQAY